LAHAKASVAPQTYRRYRQIVENDLIPDLGRIRLADLTPLQIQGFLARSQGRKCKNRERDLSPRTVLHYHRLLRRALHQAVRWGLLARNPADLVDPPRVTPVEMKALDEDGLVALLGVVRDTKLHLPTLLAAVTGMRRGELLALRWSDLDLETGECRVVRALQETPEGVGFKAPKTARGRRVVLLPRLAVSALKAHRTAQNEERLRKGAEYQDGDLILARADGSPWPPSQFSSEFARLVKKRGIRCRFHDLRHTHASQLLKAGVPVKVVSERLGHSTTSITMDIYAHTLPNMQAEAVAKIDAALGKAIGE
ncbi:MAG: tyrosine-type recombinase/integrase, partial [Actinomycetia bacterium]|nr:tyrosine-type recombinase/integrase [Actinomycetes bacterium]